MMPPPPCPPPFEWTSRAGSAALVCRALEAWHGWTTRELELGGPDDGADGWSRLAAAAGPAPPRLARLHQVHGNIVVHARDGLPGETPTGDALISCDPGVLAAVRVADCVPLLIADPATGAVAAVHAGWRGTCAAVAHHAVDAMVRTFGSRPARLVAALGPSIGPCCYETGAAVRDALRRAGWPGDLIEGWFEGPERRHLNLWRANRDQLMASGLDPRSVFACSLCTACHPGWFHSYRRDGPRAGRLAAYIRAAAAS